MGFSVVGVNRVSKFTELDSRFLFYVNSNCFTVRKVGNANCKTCLEGVKLASGISC